MEPPRPWSQRAGLQEGGSAQVAATVSCLRTFDAVTSRDPTRAQCRSANTRQCQACAVTVHMGPSWPSPAGPHTPREARRWGPGVDPAQLPLRPVAFGARSQQRRGGVGRGMPGRAAAPPSQRATRQPLVGVLGTRAVGVRCRPPAAAGPVEEEGSPSPEEVSACSVFFLVPIVQLSEVCSADSALARPPGSWRAGWLPCGGPGKGCSWGGRVTPGHCVCSPSSCVL